MPLLGQASGGFTESSSALRILHVGIRNTIGVLTADSFTQTNPPTATLTQSDQVDATKLGALSGSIAFSRPDEGSNYIGVPLSTGYAAGHLPLGVFINSANGNSFENTPGTASGKGPYVSSQGTYGNSLFETYNLNTGGALTYATGDQLIASLNGYLTNVEANNSYLQDSTGTAFTGADNSDDIVIGIVKMPADSVQGELVYDQRI